MVEKPHSLRRGKGLIPWALRPFSIASLLMCTSFEDGNMQPPLAKTGRGEGGLGVVIADSLNLPPARKPEY